MGLVLPAVEPPMLISFAKSSGVVFWNPTTVSCGWVSILERYQVFQYHQKGRKNGSCPLLGLFARFLVFGFDGFRLKIDENCRKKEMTLVLKLNYLGFLVSRKITMPSQGGYFRD
jgi:hypothetical protein